MTAQPIHHDLTIEGLVLLGIFAAAIYWIIRWVRESPEPQTPDPWSEEIESAVQNPDAVPICHRCFTPQDHHGWFCPKCGTATGPYNNLMPFINVFSEGEVLRACLFDHLRPGFFITFGYILFAVGAFVFMSPIFILALPWNLYLFFQNLHRQKSLANNIEDNHVQPPLA
jgi:hypothetical protein